MMLKQLSVMFGDPLKLKEQLKNSNMSSRMMVVMQAVGGWTSWWSRTLEVVSRLLLDITFK